MLKPIHEKGYDNAKTMVVSKRSISVPFEKCFETINVHQSIALNAETTRQQQHSKF